VALRDYFVAQKEKLAKLVWLSRVFCARTIG